MLLKKSGPVRLKRITDEHLFHANGKSNALRKMKSELGELPPGTILCDSTSGANGISAEESALWKSWTGPRFSPKQTMGEGLMASAAWQVVTAVDAISHHVSADAIVSISGFHQHAMGAHCYAE